MFCTILRITVLAIFVIANISGHMGGQGQGGAGGVAARGGGEQGGGTQQLGRGPVQWTPGRLHACTPARLH